MSQGAVFQYLDRFAEPETSLTHHIPKDSCWNSAIAIPLYQEVFPSHLLDSLSRAASTQIGKSLAILVLNGKESDAHFEIEINRELLMVACKGAVSLAESPPIYFRPYSAHLDLIIVDRVTPPFLFPPKQGVGLARKIGCDIALRLIHEQRVDAPFIATTDGDATVSQDYLTTNKPHDTEISALVSPYTHSLSDYSDSTPLLLYEISLRYYVLGLHFALSPYAFSTIGSSLHLHCQQYAEVRGFPKREAGEDFHILNKLRKVGKITLRSQGLVTLRGRDSNRVPFGTGVGTKKISDSLRALQPFCLYSPQSFDLLSSVLKGAHSTLASDTLSWKEALHQEMPRVSMNSFSVITSFFEGEGWDGLFPSIRKTRHSLSQRMRHFHTTFDGMRTLKFIHHIRDHLYPKISWKLALAEAPFLAPWEDGLDEMSSLNALRALDFDLTTASFPHFESFS